MQTRIRGTANWMHDSAKVVTGQAKHLAHQGSGANEVARHHGNGQDACGFPAERVMQTARRTTASITNAGNGEIPSASVSDNCRFSRGALIGLLAINHLCDLELVVQRTLKVGKEALRAFLAVRDKSDSLAGQRGKARASAMIGGATSPEGSSTR